MKLAQILAFAVSILVSMNANGQDLPPFLEALVAQYEGASEGGSRVEIWQYEYQGEPVFYLPLARAFCCDILSVLYDAEGEVICRPDGGFTGRGDGRCPDFFEQRSAGVLVWRGTGYADFVRNVQPEDGAVDD